METNNRIYLEILEDSLKKKIQVLKTLYDLTQWQEKILSEPELNEEEFNQSINEKENQLMILEELDQGFESLYKKVRLEIKQKPETFKQYVKNIQYDIEMITDFSVKIQAMEARNKEKFRYNIAEERKKVNEVKMNNQRAASYYKNMSNQHQDGLSYFMDKRN